VSGVAKLQELICPGEEKTGGDMYEVARLRERICPEGRKDGRGYVWGGKTTGVDMSG